MKITFVYDVSGDWVAIYFDGKIQVQGHSISENQVAEMVAEAVYESKEKPEVITRTGDCGDGGWYPDNISEVNFVDDEDE